MAVWGLINIFPLSETDSTIAGGAGCISYLFFFRRGEFIEDDEFDFKHVCYEATLGHLCFVWNKIGVRQGSMSPRGATGSRASPPSGLWQLLCGQNTETLPSRCCHLGIPSGGVMRRQVTLGVCSLCGIGGWAGVEVVEGFAERVRAVAPGAPHPV